MRTYLRQRLVEGPNSISARTRQRRYDLVQRFFPRLEDMSVVDLGGRVSTWMNAPVRPKSVHIINLEGQSEVDERWLTVTRGDACCLTVESIGHTYDLVFSNSVLEHVGGHTHRQRFADSVHALGDSHWIQTPYRYFPVEPHWLFPGMQFLPLAARTTIAHRWVLVHTRSHTRKEALRDALAVELVSMTEMRHYFPDSQVIKERFLGLPKSIMAVKVGERARAKL